MTDRPYTDEDLRTEAAHQHYTATTDPDFVGIGEQMDGSRIESTVTDPDAPAHTVAGGRTWDMLAPDDYDAAMRSIDNLLGNAADTSTWAVNLGADGLEPSNEHVITIDGGDKPIARIHFAFEPGMDDDMRTALVEGIGQVIDAHL